MPTPESWLLRFLYVPSPLSRKRIAILFSSRSPRTAIQIIAIVAVVLIAVYLIHNTITNLNNRGITSGFAFLDRSAGFGIVQHLIDYQEGDTYGRVFVVGLLNTLLVSALCIVFASVTGFFIGLARLSENWLLRSFPPSILRRFATSRRCCRSSSGISRCCVIFPVPAAVDAFELFFLSNRGLYIPSPQVAEGIYAFIVAIIVALAISVGLFRYNRKHQIKTGQLRKTWPVAAALIVGLPLVAHWLLVQPCTGIFLTYAGSTSGWYGVNS